METMTAKTVYGAFGEAFEEMSALECYDKINSRLAEAEWSLEQGDYATAVEAASWADRQYAEFGVILDPLSKSLRDDVLDVVGRARVAYEALTPMAA